MANEDSNTVSVLLGNGNGTFQAATHLRHWSSNPDCGGGWRCERRRQPDLVVANEGSNTVSVLLGNGNGTFQAQQTFATGIDPRSWRWRM